MTDSTETAQRMLRHLAGNLKNLSSKRKSQIDNKETFEIIEIYGQVLSHCSKNPWAFPESILPLSTDKIKSSLESAILVIEDTNTIKHLRDGYLQLATFIKDKEAEIVNNYHKELDQTLPSGGFEEWDKWRESKGIKYFEMVKEIQDRIVDKTSLLFAEYANFILKHKKGSEIYNELKKASQILKDLIIK